MGIVKKALQDTVVPKHLGCVYTFQTVTDNSSTAIYWRDQAFRAVIRNAEVLAASTGAIKNGEKTHRFTISEAANRRLEQLMDLGTIENFSVNLKEYFAEGQVLDSLLSSIREMSKQEVIHYILPTYTYLRTRLETRYRANEGIESLEALSRDRFDLVDFRVCITDEVNCERITPSETGLEIETEIVVGNFGDAETTEQGMEVFNKFASRFFRWGGSGGGTGIDEDEERWSIENHFSSNGFIVKSVNIGDVPDGEEFDFSKRPSLESFSPAIWRNDCGFPSPVAIIELMLSELKSYTKAQLVSLVMSIDSGIEEIEVDGTKVVVPLGQIIELVEMYTQMHGMKESEVLSIYGEEIYARAEEMVEIDVEG